MAIAFAIFGITFAAFCIWLTVRIINRRERWAKWTLVALGVLVAYPLSVGPAVSLSVIIDYPEWLYATTRFVYAPIGWAQEDGPDWLKDIITEYARYWTILALRMQGK